MPPTSSFDSWPIPEFSLRVDDLNHQGARTFFANIHPYDALRHAVLRSFKTFYTPITTPRKVKAITLILRVMEQLAYTTGSNSHKEIHLSLDWIERNSQRAKDEIMGVLIHEVVHCYQYDASGTCPSGLIEGIADFVRLRASLAPPHWKRTQPEPTETWDAGYDKTAYFLDWIETTYGSGKIRALNASLSTDKYGPEIFHKVFGRPVRQLWILYRASFSAPSLRDRPLKKRRPRRTVDWLDEPLPFPGGLPPSSLTLDELNEYLHGC
ncbi:hypothetical protein Agabi119p4_414 [Agaricus bisporus var. burnettii]|uniref:Uncharacterized protein n=1 Tax=Agaricus bisporus var. burnettii TaxID=192524 RepID=A0A8H7FAP9_AGABI|nr:hypothetical protein Agabi119p4_414 [Agaricus bisporus var. burnettii]